MRADARRDGAGGGPAVAQPAAGGAAARKPTGGPAAAAGGPVHPVPDALGYLAGRWRVSRTVRDLADGGLGAFEGVADFRPRPDGGLAHREEGDFTWRGVTRAAHREHRYEPAAPSGTALVRFPDGRPFHPLDLRTGRWHAEHGCPPDRYRGEFTVLGPDRWQVVWSVAGPAKRLLLATVHHRLLGRPAAV